MCPRLFTIGSFSVPTYGLLVALGFRVGLMIGGRLSWRVGLDPDTMTNLGIYVAVAAGGGAKVFMMRSGLGY
jgi:phosphatidylglycerol:prolipoprotein diacylglycerol transferase